MIFLSLPVSRAIYLLFLLQRLVLSVYLIALGISVIIDEIV